MADEDKYCPLGKRRKQIISLAKRRKEIFRSDSPTKNVSVVDKDEIENTDSEPEIYGYKKPYVTMNARTSEDDDNCRMIKPSKKVCILSDIKIKKPLYYISPKNSTFVPDQRAPWPVLAPAPVEASSSSSCNLREPQPVIEQVWPSDQRIPSPALTPAPVEASSSASYNLPEPQPVIEQVWPSDQCTPSSLAFAPAPVEASSSASCNLPEPQPVIEQVWPSDQCTLSSPAVAPAPAEASKSVSCNLPEPQPVIEQVWPSDQCTPSSLAVAPAPVEASSSASCNLPEPQPVIEQVWPSDQCTLSSPAVAPAPAEASSSASCNLPEPQPVIEQVWPSDQCTPSSPAVAPAPVEASSSASCNLAESQSVTELVWPSDQYTSSPALAPAPVEASSSTSCNLPESQGFQPATEHVSNVLTPITSDLKLTSSQKRKRRRTKLKKAFIDFVSDTEEHDFSSGSSDLWASNNESSSSDNSEEGNKTKKNKRKKLQKKKNKKDNNPALIEVKKKRVNKTKLRKFLRDSGKSYATRDGTLKTDKEMKENPCNAEKFPRKCYEISEERRKSLHDHFWNLDTLRRRDWILRSAQAVPIKRRKRLAIDNNRRQTTYEYTINQGEGHTQVCQKFLLNTLCISQKYILYTIKNSHENMAQCYRRRPNVAEIYSEEAKQYVKTYIANLPAVPSHYNRKRSNKTYLPQEFKNVSNLYRLYSEHCKSMQNEDSPDPKYQIVSERLFRNIFCVYNISFHVPKKDKCIQCTKNENNQNTVSNEDVQNHLAEKTASYKRFKIHQNLRPQYNDTVVCSFDLQKVLNTPHGDSMLLYYSRKYAVYNLTFYESVTQNVFCFTWGESEGKRGSNEIATALTKYLEIVDQGGIQNVILYCDSCSGQNKNKNVLAAINNFLQVSKHIEVVQINYLPPGHTYMPVDSVHAVIEREVRRLIVWSPSQWATYFESARKQPRPYTVVALDHTDFLNFDDFAAEIFTKNTLKNIKFKDIRIATMKKKATNKIVIKYSMKEHTECHEVTLCDKTNTKTKGKGTGKGRKKDILNQTKTNEEPLTTTMIKKLYDSELPISDAKYKDLISLCEKGVIPKRFHNEYRQLPTHSSVKDRLAETDDEDDEDNE